MAIKGSLKEASLPDVLQLLAMGGKTGCLSVTDRSNFGYVYFEKGRIVYATLLNRRDRLGDILVKDEVISREQLDVAVEEQGERRDGRRLGEILRDHGHLDEETLKHYVKVQIEEAVYHLFTWDQGTFHFEPGQRPEEETILVSIHPESLLLEGARRVDEWSQIEKKIPSFDLIFSVDTDRIASLSDEELTDAQRQIIPYLDGSHTLWEVTEETALPEFEVGKGLYGLISAGLVRRSGVRDGQDRRAEARARVDEHRNLGVAFYKTAMFEEAVREFRRVLELDSTALEAVFYLGLVALREGDAATAAQRFREVIDRGGRRAAAYNNLAVALEQPGKLTEAIGVLDEAFEQGCRHPKLFLSRAILQLKLADPAAAKSTLEEYRERVGEELPPIYYSFLAQAEALLGDLEAAACAAEQGLERHADSAALSNNAGAIYERRGELNRAHDLYQMSFEDEPSLAQASKNLGDVFYRNGSYDDAAEAYERAVRLDPDLGDDVYAKLGNVYYKGRDRERAVQMWIRALELNPENEVVRTNLELVRGAAGDD